MKFIHLSDLHLGKRVYEFSMLEEQEYILNRILDIIDQEAPDGVWIAGDVYDKAVPPTEAVELFDQFLVNLAHRNLPTFVISGNHDSPERLAFGNRLMDLSGIHLSPVYNGTAAHDCLEDEYGTVHLYMLPFLKPANVRRFFPDEEIADYTDAVRAAIRQMKIDPSCRNVLIAHQFITGAARSESEEISVGGVDNVSASVFDDFDYVALGHIHTPQNIETNRIRYAGSPLKYSFSETEKSVTVVELEAKGILHTHEVPLVPQRNMVNLRGTYEALTRRDVSQAYEEDYVHITLTDENDIPGAVGRLRIFYPRLMQLDYDNARTRQNEGRMDLQDPERQSPLELFADFYEQCNNAPMSEEQSSFIQTLMEEIWEREA